MRRTGFGAYAELNRVWVRADLQEESKWRVKAEAEEEMVGSKAREARWLQKTMITQGFKFALVSVHHLTSRLRMGTRCHSLCTEPTHFAS